MFIPKAVFEDAKIRAFWSKKAAVVTMACFTAASTVPCQAMLLSNKQPKSAQASYLAKSSVYTAHSSKNKIEHRESEGSYMRPLNTIIYDLDEHHLFEIVRNLRPSGLANKNMHINSRANIHGPSIILTNRGGQNQLYASRYASIAALSLNSVYLHKMPPCSEGGIFIGIVKKLSGDSSCC
jgi:hypothetical protein